MKKTKGFVLVTVALFFVVPHLWGWAEAGTVRIETSSGSSACATYYTQGGDRATGDARVVSGGSVNLTTEGSVQMGLVRADSGGGSRSFSPFTGDFSARARAGAGGGAGSFAESTDPRADIFVVSQPGNSTVGHYTVDGIPGASYGSVGAAVSGAGGGAGVDPDWILVDQGTYNEQVVMNNDSGKGAYNGPFGDDSALTSVWGADDTTIDAGNVGGSAVAIEDIPGIRVEGFTVTGAVPVPGPPGSPDTWGHGVYIEDSPKAIVTCNTATRNFSGIAVSESDDAQIRRNTVTQNVSGIASVLNANAAITENTVTQNISGIAAVLNANPRITDNTVTENISGVAAALNVAPVMARNEVSQNVSGIAAAGNLVPVIARNEVTENISGIAAVLNAVPVIAGNEVSENVSGIAAVANLRPVIARNEVKENISGIAAVLNAVPVIAGNEVSENVSGIAAVANYIPVIANNTVTDNVSGIAVVGNNWVPPLGPLPENRAFVVGNTVSDNAWNGIWVRSTDNANIAGNTVTRNQGNGIRLRNSDDADILENTVTRNQGNGISLRNSNDAGIVLNTVTSNQGNGLFLRESHDATILGNTVSSNERNGISLRNSDNAQILLNTVTNNQGNGILLQDSNDAQIGIVLPIFPFPGIGNTISGNAQSGIRLVDSDNAQIRSNDIVGNNTAAIPNHGGISVAGTSAGTVIGGGAFGGNNIQGNANAGVHNDTPNNVDARGNWWGDASGPTVASNPGGTGDAILNPGGGAVPFIPFVTNPVP